MQIGAAKKLLRSRGLIWLVFLAALVGVILVQAIPGPQQLDDSFITYRYSRNIVSGVGFVYNPGERVQGSSTPIYTLLLAALAFPFGANSIPTISFIIALVADVINTVLMFRLARHLLKNEVIAFVLAMVFVLQPFRALIARGGMETSLYILFLLAMYDRLLVGQKIYLTAIFASLAILTRIDAILAVAPVFAYMVWKQPRSALKASLLVLAIIAPWYIWATFYFGNPLPHSILAKLTYYHYSVLDSLFFLLTFVGTGTSGPYHTLPLIFPGLVFFLFLMVTGLRRSWVIGSAVWVVIAYPLIYFLVMAVQKAPVLFPWYYLPLMPGFLILFGGALQYLLEKNFQNKPSWQQGGFVALFGLSLVLFPAVLINVYHPWNTTSDGPNLFQAASFAVKSKIQTGDLVMMPDIGIVGWELGSARILDPVGLVSPISLSYFNRDYGSGSMYLQMVIDQKPEFVLGRDEFFKFLVDQPQFLQGYHLIFTKDPVNPMSDRVRVYQRNFR
ncbi:MAG TPA: hypothetical protein VGJ97_06525 [Anaerolineaceae bacterium]